MTAESFRPTEADKVLILDHYLKYSDVIRKDVVNNGPVWMQLVEDLRRSNPTVFNSSVTMKQIKTQVGRGKSSF